MKIIDKAIRACDEPPYREIWRYASELSNQRYNTEYIIKQCERKFGKLRKETVEALEEDLNEDD